MLHFRTRLRSFLGLGWNERLVLLESIVLFWFFCGALKLIPFRRFTRVLGPEGPKDDPAAHAPSGTRSDEIQTIARSMRRINQRHPNTCLPQALAGRIMVRRRSLPSTVSLGTRKDADGGMDFHAWLIQDDRVVTGGGQLASFSVIATFHDTQNSR